jgi:predicted nucleic acid-binding protein
VILVDSSVWVDLLRGAGRGPELASLLRTDAHLAATEPVLMELLAGTRTDDEYGAVRSLVTAVDWIGVDPASDFEGAAQIYAACRRAGITPRGLTDCLIAAIAVRTNCQILTSDRDFAAMSDAVELTLV